MSAPVLPKRSANGRLSGGNPGNSGGKPGRSGRPPNAFKEFCAEIADSAEFKAALKEAVTNPSLKAYGPALKLVVEHSHGKPAQEIQGALTIRVVREGTVQAQGGEVGE